MSKTKRSTKRKCSDSDIILVTTEISARLKKAREASVTSLEDYRAIGTALINAKSILPRGQYLPWAKKEFNFSKQWCARLTKLSASWADYENARSWAEAQEERLGRKEYSIDGALSLIGKWQRHTNPAPTKEPNSAKKPTGLKAQVEELRLKLEEADAKLKEADAKAEELRRQLDEALADNRPRQERHPTSPRRSRRRSRSGSPISPAPIPLDDAMIEKVRKMAELWRRGATDGERSNAEGRLRHIAEKYHWEFEIFLRKYKIESPVDWTFDRAA